MSSCPSHDGPLPSSTRPPAPLHYPSPGRPQADLGTDGKDAPVTLSSASCVVHVVRPSTTTKKPLLETIWTGGPQARSTARRPARRSRRPRTRLAARGRAPSPPPRCRSPSGPRTCSSGACTQGIYRHASGTKDASPNRRAVPSRRRRRCRRRRRRPRRRARCARHSGPEYDADIVPVPTSCVSDLEASKEALVGAAGRAAQTRPTTSPCHDHRRLLRRRADAGWTWCVQGLVQLRAGGTARRRAAAPAAAGVHGGGAGLMDLGLCRREPEEGRYPHLVPGRPAGCCVGVLRGIRARRNPKGGSGWASYGQATARASACPPGGIVC